MARKFTGATTLNKVLSIIKGELNKLQTQINQKAAKTVATQSANGLQSAADKKKTRRNSNWSKQLCSSCNNW